MPRATGFTALIVAVPEAEPAVGAVRLAHDESATKGVPAHITVLFPFLPPERVDEDALRPLFASRPAFEFELDRVERFDNGVTWLHPEPSLPFSELTRLVWGVWPDHPPYEGAVGETIPHLTVSRQPIAFVLERPIRATAHEVTLIEEVEPDGRWTTRARFPLQG